MMMDLYLIEMFFKDYLFFIFKIINIKLILQNEIILNANKPPYWFR